MDLVQPAHVPLPSLAKIREHVAYLLTCCLKLPDGASASILDGATVVAAGQMSADWRPYRVALTEWIGPDSSDYTEAAVLQLADGRWFYLNDGCDYTGHG